MNILKKTNGIDLRAKGTALQGHVKIQLKDDTTGRIVEEIEHKNFFTKALDSAYNGCPFGLDSLMKLGSGVTSDNPNDSSTYKFGRIFDSLLGGIICFPESLGTSVDDYYPSFADNFPTAYASMADYSITDSRQGTFDGVSSGDTENGYRYVYNWGASGGNGTISAVALSHVNSYEYFKNPINMMFPKQSNANASRGFYGNVIKASGDKGVVAMTDKYLICINEDGNYHRRIECHELPCFNIGLTKKYDGITIGDNSYKWTINLSEHGIGSAVIWQIYEGHLWGISKGGAGASTVTFSKIDLETGSMERIEKRWAIPNTAALYRGAALKDGFFYISSSTEGIIYKCSMTSDADIDDIECGASANIGLYTTDGMPFIFGTNVIINNGVILDHSADNPEAPKTLNIPYPVYQNGVWVLTSNGWSQNLNAQILTPYCATKANLDSPVEKTPERQMIITYNVNQI